MTRATSEPASRAFDAISAALLPQPGVDEGTGFGTNPGLRVRGKIFAMLVGGELVVKLPADRCADLVAAGSAQVFQVGRRRMREWVRIDELGQTRWRQLALEAHSYVANRQLPANPPKREPRSKQGR